MSTRHSASRPLYAHPSARDHAYAEQNLERLQGAVEAERRTYILEHLGKGRLSSQDASFSTSPSSATLFTDPFGSPSSLVAPVSMAEFFRTEHSPIRTRSASLPPVSTPLMKKLSTGLLQTFKKGSPTPSRRGSNADIYSADAELASVNASRTFRAGSTFRLDRASRLDLRVH